MIRTLVEFKFPIAFALGLLFLSPSLFAQEGFNHPELEWFTIETDNFFVHYHSGTERTAQEVAKIAEYIYPTITALYHHTPDQKVTFVIRDHDDYSNGGSYFYDNKIEIWAPALDFEFRGIHPWLWNVVTHEYTHLIQIQTLMKFGRKIPSFYFQWLGYEEERRPDVLYGYPNVLVSYPLSGFVLPAWFAEGVAQYNAPEYTFDFWDTHRDMILRTALLNNKELSWDEMGVFGKNSLGNESAYNAGFSFVQYIAEHYGAETLEKISRQLGKFSSLTIDGAIRNVLGKDGKQLYEEWKEAKRSFYKRMIDSLGATEQMGTLVEDEGFGNFYTAFSPDGRLIAYVSNKGTDYLSTSSLYVFDRTTRQKKLLVPGVHSTLSFSPDGEYIYYSKITSQNKRRNNFSDLYRYNLKEKKEERLTYSLRASQPRLSTDGKHIAFVYGSDGTLNLGVCDSDGKNIRQLTHFTEGEQVFTPVWSPNGSTIAFGFSESHFQNLAFIDTTGENFRVLHAHGDMRNPFFSSDSHKLLCSWDRTGVYNLYEIDLTTNSYRQLTNVVGGAFTPAVASDGAIAYSLYTSSGYKIALIDTLLMEGKEREYIQTPENVAYSLPQPDPQHYDPKPYRAKYTTLSLIPLLRVDQYNDRNKGIDVLKPGLYFTSGEMLEHATLFGGAAINRRLERDLFLIFEYRYRLPIFYQLGLAPTATLELYNISRSIDYAFELYVDRMERFSTTVDFNLFEFDISLSHPLWTKNQTLEFRYSLSKYNQDFGSWVHPRPEFGVVKATRLTYLISNIFSFTWKYDGILPSVDKEINPIGRSISLKYSYELNDYNPRDSAEIKNGFRVPVYTPYNLHRVELSWHEHIPFFLKGHTLSLHFRGGTILGNTVDEFFNFYAGGFVGMRGYPFYALGGNEIATLNLSYRFPISTALDARFLHLYFKKLYGVLFYDFGNAWNGKLPPAKDWKSDVGFELRLETFSWYVYPTRIFFSGAYGLKRFTRTSDMLSSEVITYGREWRFYLGVLFGFEISDIIRPLKLR